VSPRKKVREPDPVCDPTERDYFMARMAACRTSLQAALELADEILGFTVDPDDDKSGKQRDEALDAAEEAVSAAALSLQEATRVWADDDSEVDPAEGEEYPDPEDDDDDEEDDDTDDPEVD
jgi:hypothetical protein